jgi:hypothetical protein
MKVNTTGLLAAIALAVAPTVHAAVIYSGGTYSQNFDSLPNTPQNSSLGSTPTGWTDDNAAPSAGNFSIPGWYLFHPTTQTEGGFSGNQRMRIGAGTANTGAFMSFGASGATERALGILNSNTLAPAGTGMAFLGARFTNNAGYPLTQLTVTYTGEQWRDGGAATPNAQSLSFGYMVNAPNIQDAGFTSAPALDFTSPVIANTGSGAAVDGNTAGSQLITATISGIDWQPGQDLWIRWADLNDSGNDHGLSVDNFEFSAIPEPGALVLAAMALATIASRPRRS